jgi:hypothetical protein
MYRAIYFALPLCVSRKENVTGKDFLKKNSAVKPNIDQ